MTDVQVTSVNRQPANRAHDGITHLAGDAWRWPRQDVVKSIESGTNTFFIVDHGRREELAVVAGPNGPYLRARTNGDWTDDLLALPECRIHEGPCDCK